MKSKKKLVIVLYYFGSNLLTQVYCQSSLNPSDYKTDSFYYAMLKKVEADSNSDSYNRFLTALN